MAVLPDNVCTWQMCPVTMDLAIPIADQGNRLGGLLKNWLAAIIYPGVNQYNDLEYTVTIHPSGFKKRGHFRDSMRQCLK